ncbi:MAG: ABC transporter permease, partial [Candidatus Eremiobacteraeota bacterium]|nr:ABC transporter permease [Candidatus Eremiobacteraeota bacterium]
MQRSSARTAATSPLASILPGFLFAVGAFVVVELLARRGLLTSYFPPPTAIFAALFAGLVNGDISSQIAMTLLTFAEGLILATVAAVTVGVLMGAIPAVFDALRIAVEFLRPIPSVAMIPLAILFFGLGTPMR